MCRVITGLQSKSRTIKLLVVSVAICAAGLPLSAQWLNLSTPGVPRTADGKVNLSAPTSRWTLAQLRAKLAPLLLQSAQAASLGSTRKSERRVAR